MTTKTANKEKKFTATRNACKLCAPLGASVAFKGIKGCVPLIHGSQGCSTYIRRYLISHYKEPIDIASSNFSEETPIFGGGPNFSLAVSNVITQYRPEMVGVCTTCLSETIGDDVEAFIKNYKSENADEKLPAILNASTPSYQGTHMDGFHEAVAAIVKNLAGGGKTSSKVNIFPGFVSPADLRYLKELFIDFGVEYIMVPDYSKTLDNPTWKEYMRIPDGGTTLEEIEETGRAVASIEFGKVLNKGNLAGRVKVGNLNQSASEFLKKRFDVPLFNLNMPIGIRLTDAFMEVMEKISGRSMPEKMEEERGRLIDLYADGHKYVFGKRVVVYGEEDFLIGMVSFLSEIGIKPVLVATGGNSGFLKKQIAEVMEGDELPMVKSGIDFEEMADIAGDLQPDLVIGNSKGYYIARELKIPIIRVGFPIHDRIGGQNILHLGYNGATRLFETIVNALIEYKQSNSPTGYKYM